MRTIASVLPLQARATAFDDEVGRVMEQLYPRLFRYARFRLERAEAEDATAAALEHMWRVRGKYSAERGGLLPWLQRVGFNAIRDAVRHVRRRPGTVALDDLQLIDSTRDLERAASLIDLRRAMARLSEADAEIIGLRYGLSLSNDETAALVGRTAVAVATATHRALQRLREEMNR
jgi:RNA polymerase sigma factor (sigma-70 family)